MRSADVSNTMFSVAQGDLLTLPAVDLIAFGHTLTKDAPRDLFEKTVIIGDSLQNGFIVMICDGNNDGVYYYDDSYYFDESNDENNVYIISNNFTEFLDMIVKR